MWNAFSERGDGMDGQEFDGCGGEDLVLECNRQGDLERWVILTTVECYEVETFSGKVLFVVWLDYNIFRSCEKLERAFNS